MAESKDFPYRISLLLLFSAAGIVFVYFVNISSPQVTGGIENSGLCGVSNLDVENVRQEGDGPIKFLITVNDNRKIENFTYSLSNDYGRIQTENFSKSSLNSSQTREVSIRSPESDMRFTDLSISFDNCQDQINRKIRLNCPEGFAGIERLGGFCIMKYEASHKDATGSKEGSSKIPISEKGNVPWTFVSYNEARDACQQRDQGHNLTTNKQWQTATEAVIGETDSFVHGNNDFGRSRENSSEKGVDDPTENGDYYSWLHEGRVLTGTGPETWSTDKGVYDLNGNVWEWVYVTSGDENGNVDQNNAMHFSGKNGFINAWNSTGEYPEELGSANNSFGQDYYWSVPEDNRAVVRGGRWRNGIRAGPFSIAMDDAPGNSRPGVGFRCAY